MLRHVTTLLMFLSFLSIAIIAVPIAPDAEIDARAGHDEQQTTGSTKASQHHWVDMFDNLQPLPTMPTSIAQSTAAAKPLDTQQHKDDHLKWHQSQHQRPEAEAATKDSEEKSALREDAAGFRGPFAQFITSQYGTNLNITDIYMRGFSAGLASIVAGVAIIISLYVLIGPLLARMRLR